VVLPNVEAAETTQESAAVSTYLCSKSNHSLESTVREFLLRLDISDQQKAIQEQMDQMLLFDGHSIEA
jgi:hypothetical protein